MANANATPPVVVAHMGRDRAQAVMAGDAAAGFDTHLGGRQVDLVVEDHDVAEVDLIEMRRLPDCQPGLVHVGARQQQDDALAVDRTFRRDPSKAPSPRANPVAPGNGFDRHEADIVTIADIARARISEPDQELHGPPTLGEPRLLRRIANRDQQRHGTPAYFFSPPPAAGAADGAPGAAPGAPAPGAGAAAAVAAAAAAAAAASAAA